MTRQKLFRYYQPNEMDKKDKYGDCQIRALSKALDCSWLEAYDASIPICRKYQIPLPFDAPAKQKAELLSELGFEYTGMKIKKGQKRPTVWQFAHQHKHGRYILNVANHVVAVVDGEYYDTWDCGDCSLYGYYEKK